MSLWKRLFGEEDAAVPKVGSAEGVNIPGTRTNSPYVGGGNPSAPLSKPVSAETPVEQAPNTLLTSGATVRRSTNRRIRVFISSTFRDMMGERDELMTHTWPDLRRFCGERQVELVEVDLRWGIAEEQSTRKETLKLCLDEIRACRPFFIGLLGERYGWVPGDDAFTADLREEQPWLRDLHGKSVTELEVLHGVLNNPDMAGRAFFYFRDPGYSKAHGADLQSENPASANKQNVLKNVIRQACAANHIPLRENYAAPRDLAAFVLEDLKAAIDAQFPIASIPDPLDREARDHEAFAEIRRRTYIGRTDYFTTLDRHAAGDGPPFVVLGDSGSGKSALLANWLARWHQAHPRDFIFQHYIGGTPNSAEHWRLITRLIAEIKRLTGDPDELPCTHDDLLKTFPVWLAKARIKAEHDGVRFILVLDALNQLDDHDHARLLGWLPTHPFTGPLRLIVSTLPGETLTAVEHHHWNPLHVEQFTPNERRRMVSDYLARFGKKLDAPRLERLAAAPAAANPLYLKILLDELRVTGTHDRLDERLTDYLAAADIPALLKRVLTRYQHDYERDRPRLVSEALGLLWAARRGLTETELLRLLKPTTLLHLPLTVWTPLRSAMEESLVDRGGILNFAHDFLRTAVETAFVADEDQRNELRLQVADDFEREPISARSCDELPWLLWQTKQAARLRACLLNIDRFRIIRDRDQEELMRYWLWLKEERTMGKAYLDSFEVWSHRHSREDSNLSYAANQLAAFLNAAALYGEVEHLLRNAVAIDERVYGSNHPALAGNLSNLAFLLKNTNRLTEAERIYRRALTVLKQDRGENGPIFATTLNNLSACLHADKRPTEAEPLYRQALLASEECYGPDHPEVAMVLNNLARLLQEENRVKEVEPLLQRGLAIWEKRFGPEHPRLTTFLNNFALLREAEGRFCEAEPVLRRALAIDEKCLGAEHPTVAIRLNNLAQLTKKTTGIDAAEPLYRRSIAIWEKRLNSNLPDAAPALWNLTTSLEEAARVEEAVAIIERGVSTMSHFARRNGQAAPGFRDACALYVGLLCLTGFTQSQSLQRLQKVAPEAFDQGSGVFA